MYEALYVWNNTFLHNVFLFRQMYFCILYQWCHFMYISARFQYKMEMDSGYLYSFAYTYSFKVDIKK